LKNDKDIVKAVLIDLKLSLKKASLNLKNNKGFIISSIEINGLLLKYASK
jgi:hypothetical protein